MIELISLIPKSLVQQPDAVSVTMVQKGTVEVYELHVAPEDMGKVSGNLTGNRRFETSALFSDHLLHRQ